MAPRQLVRFVTWLKWNERCFCECWNKSQTSVGYIFHLNTALPNLTLLPPPPPLCPLPCPAKLKELFLKQESIPQGCSFQTPATLQKENTFSAFKRKYFFCLFKVKNIVNDLVKLSWSCYPMANKSTRWESKILKELFIISFTVGFYKLLLAAYQMCAA